MFRRISVLTVASVVMFALFLSGTARAQADGSDGDNEDAAEEFASYGDTELIDALRSHDLLDDWIQASPVSPQASLLLVTGNGPYQAQRQTFLDSVQAWAARTEAVRTEVARIDSAQDHADRLRAVITQVRDALVLDDRLAAESNTLVQMADALAQLEAVSIPEHELGESDAPLIVAEIQLSQLWDNTQTELIAMNGPAQAVTSAGVGAFAGFEDLRTGLNQIDQLLIRARELVRPAREQSERLVSSALDQIPRLHAARMLSSTEVGGLSVVTVDAYIRAAERSSCSVDWALLAGIGQIESNHGRIGGASVSGSGQVSTTILGPLLDGGATARASDEAPRVEDRWTIIENVLRAGRLAAQATPAPAVWHAFETAEDVGAGGALEDLGNGFAVVVDTDDGRLDGNDEWDRAIGPMQFIPETWSKWATDGNGDGAADPHNLYDAAASASRFLCDLAATRGSSPSTFVLGYNSSTAYVRNVIGVAERLRSAALPVV